MKLPDKEESYKIARKLSEDFYSKLKDIGYPNPNELSALGCAIGDIFESFAEIYRDVIPNFEKSGVVKKDVLLDQVIELKSIMDHIKGHLEDAEQGVLKLMDFLED
jgi:hypothetical protein